MPSNDEHFTLNVYVLYSIDTQLIVFPSLFARTRDYSVIVITFLEIVVDEL